MNDIGTLSTTFTMTECFPTPPSTAHSDIAESKAPSETSQTPNSIERIMNETDTKNPRKSQKARHRASVACASCRDRRIRCVVPPGEGQCTQCTRSGVVCIIKNDDERRRPISRAYMCSLTERVALLESMLKERGATPPPANHPPKTRHGLPREDESPNQKAAEAYTQQQENTSPRSLSQSSPQDDFTEVPHEQQGHRSPIEGEGSAGSPSMLPPPKREEMVSRLLSTRGHLSFDQLIGRLRYFGPTSNFHVHSELRNLMDTAQDSSEQARRAEKIIRSLPQETHDYLMELFWQCYNSTIHVVHQEAFSEDRNQRRTHFYSGFLHVCMLAMGFRFADKSRPDMQKIALPQKESTLHREVKYMLDHELEKPGGIPSVAALLLLGDLECGVGRDNSGWLYGGLAVRLAFDIGLHLDTSTSGLQELEVEIRQMTLWACVIYDKYWALFLGRPTSMKSSDLEIYHLSKQFERLGTCLPAGPEKSLETLIYEALIDLMELAGKITENIDPGSMHWDSTVDHSQYLRMAALDHEFSIWYSRLPEQLRWTPKNLTTAPFSFFLLHQQYHSSLILLHRPFAMYDDDPDQAGKHKGSNSVQENNLSALSRTVCTKQAIRVARIFWHHRQRFDTRQIFVTGLQHAGTAATALVAALAFIKDPADRNNNMQYLECLSSALQDMAHTYQAAERMSVVICAVMVELRGEPVDNSDNFRLYKPTAAHAPARRASTNDHSEMLSFKKRQMARPRAGTSSKAINKQVHRRSMSMSTHVGQNSNAEFDFEPPLSAHALGFGMTTSDLDHSSASNVNGGYIINTPREELASWNLDPGLTSATPATSHSHGHSHSISNGLLHPPTPSSTRSAWMGAELVDINVDIEINPISPDSLPHVQPPTPHFSEIEQIPELHAMPGISSGVLDFMALSGHGHGHDGKNANAGESQWEREWMGGSGRNNGSGGGVDLDGFPPQSLSGGGAGGAFGIVGRAEQRDMKGWLV